MTDPPLHLTDHWPVTPGHELDPEDWAAVKAYADEWAGRTLEAQASPVITPETSVRYPGDGGRKDNGKRRRTQLWVVHTAECPLQTGYAVSLCRWAANGPVQASWHRMSDPGTLCRFVPDLLAAWHATVANAISVGVEQAGYAAFARSTWLTQEGVNTIDGAARAFVDAGIPASAVRRLTDAEVRRALAGDTSIEGLAGHYQIQPQNRTDPGDGYPWDVLIARIRHHHPHIESEEDDMTPEQEKKLDRILDAVLMTPTDEQKQALGSGYDQQKVAFLAFLAAARAQDAKMIGYQIRAAVDAGALDVDGLAGKIAERVPTADKESVKSAFREWLSEAAAAQGGVTQ